LTESKNTDSAAALEQLDSSETVKKLTWTKSLRVAEKKVEGVQCGHLKRLRRSWRCGMSIKRRRRWGEKCGGRRFNEEKGMSRKMHVR